MTVQDWDADQAVTRGALDRELDGVPTIDRYGIVPDEEVAGEPLSVALAQEEPEVEVDVDDLSEDQWALVQEDWDVDDRRFSAPDDGGPEAAALHLEVP